ncbi:MAG TPA: DUF4276 family protein, partial [Blastocatellia bacterium]|nr:DUF4276 family protein [Blastocatellia bacterium]
RYDVQVAVPKNAHGRSNLQKPDGLERFLKHAWKERECGAVLILLDAEGECPVTIARDFSRRAAALGLLHPVVIVCARRMYEAWFLASLETIAGKDLAGRTALLDVPLPASDVESISNPKSVLNDRFPKGRIYKETEDQEAMTRLLDTTLAKERSRSFRRLCHAVEQALKAIEAGAKIVTPSFAEEQNPPAPAAAEKRGKKRK